MHPLVNNEVLFNYYYVDGEYTNFYCLMDDDGIASICGYIKCSSSENSDIWISIWCAKKGKNGIGLALMGDMKSLTGANIISCNNIRKNTMPFYTFLGYYPDKLNHYYRLRDLPEYKIAIVKNKAIPHSFAENSVTLKPISCVEEISNIFDIPNNLSPQKDYWYVNKRYFEYPYYKYNLFGIFKDDTCHGIVVFRVNECEEGNVLRLVDYIGDTKFFSLLNGQIDGLMQFFNCEYCDMYCFGVDGKLIGFTLFDDHDLNIIPNYLNPVLSENIEYYFFTSDVQNFTMFKADGDQDRKNLN